MPTLQQSVRWTARCAVMAYVAILTPAYSQSLGVQFMTDAVTPADFGTSYPIGQASTTSYVYGSSFLVSVSYSFSAATSVSFALSGSQTNYFLAWTESGSGIDNAFTSNLGATVTGLTGSASNVYYRRDGTLQLLSVDATRFKIGAKASPAATVDLSTTVTLTVTAN